jgi:hypothetical protein
MVVSVAKRRREEGRDEEKKRKRTSSVARGGWEERERCWAKGGRRDRETRE